jgi:hypothetical protein
MLKRIKDILGIEGVKIELLLDESYSLSDDSIQGAIRISSQNEKLVQSIHLRIIEKYRRGRGDAKLIDEYILGELDLVLDIMMQRDEERVIPFELPFEFIKSEMDMAERKLLARPWVMLAKKLKNVKSTFRVEATAYIKGTRLHPIDKKEIVFK